MLTVFIHFYIADHGYIFFKELKFDTVLLYSVCGSVHAWECVILKKGTSMLKLCHNLGF